MHRGLRCSGRSSLTVVEVHCRRLYTRLAGMLRETWVDFFRSPFRVCAACVPACLPPHPSHRPPSWRIFSQTGTPERYRRHRRRPRERRYGKLRPPLALDADSSVSSSLCLPNPALICPSPTTMFTPAIEQRSAGRYFSASPRARWDDVTWHGFFLPCHGHGMMSVRAPAAIGSLIRRSINLSIDGS